MAVLHVLPYTCTAILFSRPVLPYPTVEQACSAIHLYCHGARRWPGAVDGGRAHAERLQSLNKMIRAQPASLAASTPVIGFKSPRAAHRPKQPNATEQMRPLYLSEAFLADDKKLVVLVLQ